MCNVYRRFVSNYTDIAAPLNALLRKDQPKLLKPFGEKEADAFAKLTEAVTNSPILALPRHGLPYSVDTDASDYQVGAALFQTHQDGVRRPIGYWSRSLLSAEKNYSTPEKECLAIIWALSILRPYLLGERFVVHTDQASLRWLLGITEPSGRLVRWRLRLSEFDFEVRYKKGKLNNQADALSRLRTLGETEVDIDENVPCFIIEHTAVQNYNSNVDSTLNSNGNMDYKLIYETPDEADQLLIATNPIEETELIPVTTEELLRSQLSDEYCAKIRSRLNGGRCCRLQKMIADC